MTVLQIYKLADSNNPQAIISFSEKGGEFKSININPCFYKAANRKHIEIVPKNGRKKLHDGDSFAFLADSFWFRIQLTPDGQLSNKDQCKSINKETLLVGKPKPSQQQKPEQKSCATDDLTEHINKELKQCDVQDVPDECIMKTEDVLEKADVLMSTKSKAIISGKKYKSYEESIASAGKRLYSDSETTTGCCKKIKIEPYIPPKKLLEHKPVVDTKKLLENIRQIVIEDYPEATNLLGDDSFKNTCKERKNVKTKVTGKIKSVKSLDNNSKFVKPKIVSEEMVNDNSVNDPTEALANEKVPLTDITSLGECSTQVTLSKNNIQEESVDPEKPTGIVSATDQPTGSGKVL